MILPNQKVIEYLIDGQGRRIGKKVDGVLVEGYIYQNQTQIIAVTDNMGIITKRFIYGEKLNSPDVLIQNNKEYRIISDQVGTPRLVVDLSTGRVKEELNFDEFGDDPDIDGRKILPFGFAGGLYDRDTKLVHFGQREYMPEIGRWISKDKIGFRGGDTNLYRYSGADPVNMIDPLGTDYYYASFLGHLALVVDDPNNPGGKVTIDFGPNINSILDLVKMLLGQTISAEINISSGLPFLYIPIPRTTKHQSKEEDIALLKEIQLAKKFTSKGDLGYNLLGFGTSKKPAANCYSFTLGSGSK